MNEQGQKVALFIDCDNMSADSIEHILDELSNYGTTYIKNAYGNWHGHRLKKWQDKLQTFGIKPIQQFDYTRQKNATDIAMVIDIMDLLYDATIDAFALATSDCDFTPIVMRILRSGFPVYGFGEDKTPEAFVNVCTRFINISQQSPSEKQPAIVQKKPDALLIDLLNKAIDEIADIDGWANVASVGIYISRRSSISIKNYGYKKLSDLLIHLKTNFETRYNSDQIKNIMYVKRLTF